MRVKARKRTLERCGFCCDSEPDQRRDTCCTMLDLSPPDTMTNERSGSRSCKNASGCTPAERFRHAFVCSGQNVAAGAVEYEFFVTGFQFG